MSRSSGSRGSGQRGKREKKKDSKPGCTNKIALPMIYVIAVSVILFRRKPD